MIVKTLTAAEVGRHIDTLDLLERGQPGYVAPIDALKTALAQGHKWRRITRWPFVVAGVALALVFHGRHWDWHDPINALGVTAGLAGARDLILEKLYPVMDREDRVVALLSYFGVQTPSRLI